GCTGIGSGPPLTPAEKSMVYMAEMFVSMAGEEAERLAGLTPAGCDDDHTAINAFIGHLYDLLGPPALRAAPAAREEVRRHLRENGPAVESVADALLDEQTLTGQRAAEVAGTLPRPDLRRVVAALTVEEPGFPPPFMYVREAPATPATGRVPTREAAHE